MERIPNVLFKFTKYEHAKQLLDEGVFRIGTFRDYANQEKYQIGIGDTEESFNPWIISNKTFDTHDPSPENKELVNDLRQVGVISGAGRIVGNFGQVRQAKHNCYCYTLSLSSDHEVMAKLSKDYNCCIKITNVKAFIETLVADFKLHQGLSCMSLSGMCGYKRVPAEYGSLDYRKIKEIENTPRERWRLLFIKPLEFSYQQEFRIVWLSPDDNLSPVLMRSPKAAKACELMFVL